MQYTTRSSEPLHYGDREIRLYSRALKITLPRHLGGIVWNRPVFVSVKTSAGQTEVLQVRDVTRLVQIGLLATSVFVAMISARALRRN